MSSAPIESTMNRLAALDAAGARFTLCRASSKQPLGQGWQKRPIRYVRAAAHLRAGGNIGLNCGHGGFYVIDLDKDAAQRLAQIPKLAQTKKAVRDDAPERVKCLLHTAGPLPHNRKDKKAGIEILAAGTNAVLMGTHESGATVYLTEEPILDLDADECAEIWRMCGGSEPGQGAEYHLPTGATDIQELLNAAVRDGIPGNRNAAGFALARALRDAGHSREQARGAMLDYQVAVECTGNHNYTPREALASLKSAYSRSAKTATRNPIHAEINAIERAVVTGAVDLPANVERTMMAVLAIMHSAESMEHVHCAVGEICRRANMPRATVDRHMKVICERGLLVLVRRGNYTEASVYSIGESAIARMEHPEGARWGTALKGVPFWHSGEIVPTYRSLLDSPITEPGARIDVRLAENEDQTTWSFGASAHRILVQLVVAPATGIDELAERARVSRRTAYRKVASLKAAGIVVAGEDLRLTDDWQERINGIAPALVTFGRQALREVAYARQRIAIHTHMLELYSTRPLCHRARLMDIAEAALERARCDLQHWQPFVREANMLRIEYAREHLDMTPESVPPCSLNGNMHRERKVRQPVMANGRMLIPTGTTHAGKGSRTAYERLQALISKQMLTADELASARSLAQGMGVQLETERIELS